MRTPVRMPSFPGAAMANLCFSLLAFHIIVTSCVMNTLTEGMANESSRLDVNRIVAEGVPARLMALVLMAIIEAIFRSGIGVNIDLNESGLSGWLNTLFFLEAAAYLSIWFEKDIGLRERTSGIFAVQANLFTWAVLIIGLGGYGIYNLGVWLKG